MNKEEILKQIFNIIFGLMVWVMVAIVVIVMYFYYNTEMYERMMKLMVPLGFYSIGILAVIWFRKRQDGNLVKGGSDRGVSVYLTQFDLMKHDLVMFLTPLIMIGIAKFYNSEITGFDIFQSAIAFIGLYIAGMFYKRKMKQ